ncbi:peroxisomal membrane protein 2 [Lutzomyia longipalpis]|uniref:Putative conserved plasma membrane protein n=1 Tax=Lutzomyia longipalpis TaxID=7200 RepID=A0A1B0CE16_LUTLO|nr:peroxisomal membrane protein 2 [Lutzomyia longipalpis]
MSLSKPIFNLIGTYFEQLFNHPIRTKSLTSCVIATTGNIVSQKISGSNSINPHSVFAYGLFGLIFGGTIPHYFYAFIERIFSDEVKFRKFYQFLLERLTFTPVFQLCSLYFLSRFEGNNHQVAFANLYKLYWPILQANWKYLSLFTFMNITFLPPILRVFTANLIGFFWIIFLANKRRQAAKKTE